MPTRRRAAMTIIHSIDEIPHFRSEAEEHEFWATHSLSPELLDQAKPIPDDELPPVRPRPRTQPVAIRFDGDTLRRLKILAARKHTGYQTLLKAFVLERLYQEELREGVIPGSGGGIKVVTGGISGEYVYTTPPAGGWATSIEREGGTYYIGADTMIPASRHESGNPPAPSPAGVPEPGER